METSTASAAWPVAHVSAIAPADRRAHGKRLRDTARRDAHAAWRAPADRVDPIGILRAADASRQPDLVPLRYGRMLQSPFTFYRGSAGVMAADLARTPVSGIHVQVCGDCHLMNFGGFATPERRLIFDINDLDETLPAPWEWDVKRLAPSVLVAAETLVTEPILMMRPYLRGIMESRATACATKNSPRRFVSSTRFQSSQVSSTAGLRTFSPALFTRMSILP